jgi:hypothetical protein
MTHVVHPRGLRQKRTFVIPAEILQLCGIPSVIPLDVSGQVEWGQIPAPATGWPGSLFRCCRGVSRAPVSRIVSRHRRRHRERGSLGAGRCPAFQEAHNRSPIVCVAMDTVRVPVLASRVGRRPSRRRRLLILKRSIRQGTGRIAVFFRVMLDSRASVDADTRRTHRR